MTSVHPLPAALLIGFALSFVALLWLHHITPTRRDGPAPDRDARRERPARVAGPVMGAVGAGTLGACCALVGLSLTPGSGRAGDVVGRGSPTLWVALAGGGLLGAGLLRYAARLGWARAFLLAQALTLVVTATWVPRAIQPTWDSPNVAQLIWCFSTESRWGTYGRVGLVTDALPNVLLYLPVGLALGLACRHWWNAVLLTAALTVATESYQALFTDRDCAGNDIVSNAAGGLLGVLVAALLATLRRRRRRPPS
jgi:uncharacterized protein (TIGR03382 family)